MPGLILYREDSSLVLRDLDNESLELEDKS